MRGWTWDYGIDRCRWALPICIRGCSFKQPFAYFAIEVLCFYFYIQRWEEQ